MKGNPSTAAPAASFRLFDGSTSSCLALFVGSGLASAAVDLAFASGSELARTWRCFEFAVALSYFAHMLSWYRQIVPLCGRRGLEPHVDALGRGAVCYDDGSPTDDSRTLDVRGFCLAWTLQTLFNPSNVIFRRLWRNDTAIFMCVYIRRCVPALLRSLCRNLGLAAPGPGAAREQRFLQDLNALCFTRCTDADLLSVCRTGIYVSVVVMVWNCLVIGVPALACSLGPVPALSAVAGLPLYGYLWVASHTIREASMSFSLQQEPLCVEIAFLMVTTQLYFASAAALSVLSQSAYMDHGMALPILLWRWFCFRFMLAAGLVKHFGSTMWKDGTAMLHHYYNQPLPNPLSYFFHHWPELLHRLSVKGLFVIQLVAPFWIFLPTLVPRALVKIWEGATWSVSGAHGPPDDVEASGSSGPYPSIATAGDVSELFRAAAAFLFVALMVMINLSGNYGCLGLLTIVLTIPLLSDRVWTWVVFPSDSVSDIAEVDSVGTWLLGLRLLTVDLPYALFILAYIAGSCVPLLRRTPVELPRFCYDALRLFPWRLVNVYGPFGAMHDYRHEIRVFGLRRRGQKRSAATGQSDSEGERARKTRRSPAAAADAAQCDHPGGRTKKAKTDPATCMGGDPEPVAEKKLRRMFKFGEARRMERAGPSSPVEGREQEGAGSEQEEHEWVEYRFRYKPYDVGVCPPDVTLRELFHWPRFEWFLWFIPLRASRRVALTERWAVRFMEVLLENSDKDLIRELVKENPFEEAGGEEGPAAIAMSVYDFQFANVTHGSGGGRLGRLGLPDRNLRPDVLAGREAHQGSKYIHGKYWMRSDEPIYTLSIVTKPTVSMDVVYGACGSDAPSRCVTTTTAGGYAIRARRHTQKP